MAALERSDLQENATAYAAQLAGEAQTRVAQFGNISDPLTFNTSHHGLCYSVGLLVRVGASWSRAVRSIAVLTSKEQHWFLLRLQWSAVVCFSVLFLLRTFAGPLGSRPGLQGVPRDRSGL